MNRITASSLISIAASLMLAGAPAHIMLAASTPSPQTTATTLVGNLTTQTATHAA